MKLNKAILILLFVTGGFTAARAQDIYVTSTSETTFFSETRVEDIKATSPKAISAVNIKTDSIFIKIPIKSFHFRNGMMQEHFNENFMESDDFPYGEFKGIILGDVDYTKDGTYEASVKGKLTIHGVSKQRTIEGRIIVKDGGFTIETTFIINLIDHDIDRPKMLMLRVAEQIEIKMKTTYKPYIKKEN